MTDTPAAWHPDPMAEGLTEKAEALRRKSEMLDKTIDSMADAVLMVDAEGGVLFGNAV